MHGVMLLLLLPAAANQSRLATARRGSRSRSCARCARRSTQPRRSWWSCRAAWWRRAQRRRRSGGSWRRTRPTRLTRRWVRRRLRKGRRVLRVCMCHCTSQLAWRIVTECMRHARPSTVPAQSWRWAPSFSAALRARRSATRRARRTACSTCGSTTTARQVLRCAVCNLHCGRAVLTQPCPAVLSSPLS